MQTDTTLLLAQQGDPAAFHALYHQHRSRVYTRCLGMLHNPQDAEDMTQEVFLCLHQKLASFQGRSSFTTWLYRLATNVVLMKLRGKRLDTTSLDDDTFPTELLPVVHPQTGSRAEEVEHCLGRLPIRVRSVARLRFQEGLTVDEIALILGEPENVVAHKVKDARDKLRVLLAPTVH